MKKNNVRVIQINGLRGLLLTFFMISCLVAGFIAFPAFMSMNVWNYFAVKSGSMPLINLQEGILLWAIIVLCGFVFCKRKFIVSFSAEDELSESHVQRISSKVKEINSPVQQDELNQEIKKAEEIKSDK